MMIQHSGKELAMLIKGPVLVLHTIMVIIVIKKGFLIIKYSVSVAPSLFISQPVVSYFSNYLQL